MLIKLFGYHGTNNALSINIQKTGYNESNSDAEWLGSGIYFFVDGISDPVRNAQDWARAQAWDSKKQENRYDKISVLKSEIELDDENLIDITHTVGLKNFNQAKEHLLENIYKDFEIRKFRPEQQNCILFNFMVKEFDAHAVKHNLYIKAKRERLLKLKLHVPNTTVLCVIKSASNPVAEEIFVGEVNER